MGLQACQFEKRAFSEFPYGQSRPLNNTADAIALNLEFGVVFAGRVLIQLREHRPTVGEHALNNSRRASAIDLKQLGI